MKSKSKIKCPYCGYEMPIYFDKSSRCRGIFVCCKGRNCKKQFEIVINDNKNK
nr:MAG TPA: cysteine-rich protein [Caudoviricetes sp.]DAO01668.1 MAG TPA: cysteine-rich protein [Caudoviricetes sp.]